MSTDAIDSDTERLARQLAQATGKPVRDVVREAVEAKALAVGIGAPLHKKVDMKKIDAILKRIDSLPIRDPRPADEIIDYDEFGLPK